MTKFLWINPVTLNMLRDEGIDVNGFAKDLEFEFIDVNPIIAKGVKKLYVDYLKGQAKTIIDARCPLAVDYICEQFSELKDNIAPIKPIFITTAHVLYDRYINKETSDELYMISPCNALCNCDRELGSRRITYITWKDFKSKFNIEYDFKPISTPIPMGFFDNCDIKVYKANSKEDIDGIKEVIKEHNYDLIEVLYCKGGCHNGDGL